MSITLSALQKQRRDTAANWTGANPTLLAGEIGIESDTKKIKIGDGATAWNSLGYQPAGSSVIAETKQVIDQNYTLSTGFNGISAGPVEVAATYAVTVPAGATWVISQ